MTQLAAGVIHYCHVDPEGDRPAPSRATEWRGFIGLVDTVTAAGMPPPDAYGALLARWQRVQHAVVGDRRTMAARLKDAVLSGTGPGSDDLEGLLAAALSERHATASELQAGLLSEVRDQVLGQLRDLYAPVARRHYAVLASRFDSAAQAFTRCAAIIPPDSLPNQVINTKPKTLRAWREAAGYADQLDQLIEPLCAAAELVRPLTSPSGIGSDRNHFLLPLCADITDVHRRVAWHAWSGLPAPQPPGVLTRAQMEAPPPEPLANRCGRWARLISVGAIIRAHPNPAELELFDLLKPIGVKRVPARNKAAYVRVDPEGDLNAPRRRGPTSILLDRLSGFRRRADEPDVEPDIDDTFADADTEPREEPQPYRYRGDRGEA